MSKNAIDSRGPKAPYFFVYHRDVLYMARIWKLPTEHIGQTYLPVMSWRFSQSQSTLRLMRRMYDVDYSLAANAERLLDESIPVLFAVLDDAGDVVGRVVKRDMNRRDALDVQVVWRDDGIWGETETCTIDSTQDAVERLRQMLQKRLGPMEREVGLDFVQQAAYRLE